MAVAATSVMADSQSERHARQLGNVCGFDMTKPTSVKDMQAQPAYFWLVAQGFKHQGGDMPIRYLMAAKAAISCDRGKIVVNEAAAEKLIAAVKNEEAKISLQTNKGKSGS